MKKIVIGVLLAGIAIIVAAAGFFCWAAFSDHVETGFRRQNVDWLPRTASDISFFHNSNFANNFAYEFHISRSDFEALARERNWAVTPLDKEVSVIRYTRFLPQSHPEHKEPFSTSASKGLFYEVRRGDGGGTTVLFDDMSSMVYVFKCNR